jgi:hypothetical protein
MKYSVLIQQRNVSLERVMTGYPEVSAEKPEILAAIATFGANNLTAAGLLATLAYPRSVLFRPKHIKAKKIRVLLARMAGIGVLMATRQKDEAKAEMYMDYKRKASKGTAWELSQNALQVAASLTDDAEAAANVGLTADMIEELQVMANDFSELLETTDARLKQRKAAGQELKVVLKENAAIIRLQFDPYANFIQEANPPFYREFKIARRYPIASKPAAGVNEILAELSGTVTDGATGQPVEGATVMVTGLNMVAVTDEDGYYLFEDVPVGSFAISCHATNYKLPGNVQVTVADTVPLQLDFSLEAETGEQVT